MTDNSQLRPLTNLLQLAADNDVEAKDELYRRVYDDLKLAARRILFRERNVGEMQTTALVNEVILRFEASEAIEKMANRRVFFSVAIRAMNNALVDHYRRRKKLIDSPDRVAAPLDDAVKWIEDETGFDFERLQIELEVLATESPRQHSVVMHRFFGGLSVPATAELLETSVATVDRDWRVARAKLLRRMREDEE